MILTVELENAEDPEVAVCFDFEGLDLLISKLEALRKSGDLPLKFHPAAIRASAVFDTPNGAVGATGGNAKLPDCVALEPVAAMIPA